MDEKRRSKVSELETDEQVAFSLQEKENKRAHVDKMQAFIDDDEVLYARVAELYKDKTLTDDDIVQRLVDLINERSEELALSQLIKSIKQGQSQKRKRNPTRSQLISEMKTYLKNQRFYKPHQLRGKTYEEIERLYYHCKRYIEKKYIPMGTEEIPSKKKRSLKTSLLRRRMIHKEMKIALLLIR